MEFSWPGEKLLIKLWDTVAAKGVGSLLKPWQMRREGAAAAEIKRLSSLTLAQTKIDAAEIAAGRKVLLTDGKLGPANIDALDQKPAAQVAIVAELEDILATSIRNEAFRKEVSVAKAILYAEQELEQETEKAADIPVSDDWLYRWRDNASSVSSDELQMLWGKVLAGEVKSPGAFSLRTLEFLRNISRVDAALIEKIAPYVTSGVVFRPGSDGMSNENVGNVSFGEILELQELGILYGVEALGMQTTYHSTEPHRYARPLTSHGRLVFVTHVDMTRELTLPIYGVTKIGHEVLGLGWKRADEGHLQALGERIKSMGFDVQIGDYVKADEGRIGLLNMRNI